jgi:hypothetical protein
VSLRARGLDFSTCAPGSILKTGKPYANLGADFYTRRESPDARQDYLMRQLQKLHPGCVITITPAEAA